MSKPLVIGVMVALIGGLLFVLLSALGWLAGLVFSVFCWGLGFLFGLGKVLFFLAGGVVWFVFKLLGLTLFLVPLVVLLVIGWLLLRTFFRRRNAVSVSAPLQYEVSQTIARGLSRFEARMKKLETVLERDYGYAARG